ncbi:hypothetical protein V2I01_04915 [Micromonospora sp. BRA006-A]|nr:hypothetical protein [Micromonospora sp. BRA006-A]
MADLKRRHNPLFVVAQDKGPTGSAAAELADLGSCRRRIGEAAPR